MPRTRDRRAPCVPDWEHSGRPIGPYDILIAGQARARGLVLVTANTREFARVDGLEL